MTMVLYPCHSTWGEIQDGKWLCTCLLPLQVISSVAACTFLEMNM